MYEIKEKTKDSIIKIISAFYPNAKIFLYGSYARGTAKASSDIDVAVDIGKQLDIHEWSFLWNLLDALPTAQLIDLADMNRIPEKMRNIILEEGIIWKS